MVSIAMVIAQLALGVAQLWYRGIVFSSWSWLQSDLFNVSSVVMMYFVTQRGQDHTPRTQGSLCVGGAEQRDFTFPW